MEFQAPGPGSYDLSKRGNYDQLVGSTVQLYWADDDTWYNASVTSFDPDKGLGLFYTETEERELVEPGDLDELLLNKHIRPADEEPNAKKAKKHRA